MSKLDEPESVRQAERFDRIAAAYRDDGFCNRCAAQAAFGHQSGFANVRPCCDACRGIVPSWTGPGSRAHRWAGVENDHRASVGRSDDSADGCDGYARANAVPGNGPLA